MIGIVIVTHGLFGQELLRTTEDIVGRQAAVVVLTVGSETGLESLSHSIDEAIAQLQSTDGLLFCVDMLGGTPCNAALLKARNMKAEVVTGVNLYMLISAFTHRAQMDLKTLAARSAEDGRRAIVLAKDLLLKKAP